MHHHSKPLTPLSHTEDTLSEFWSEMATQTGSSAKSVGGRWLLKPTKLVIECYLQAVQCFKAVCLFDSEFCLVI